MNSFVDRENQIFETLEAFQEAGLDFVVVGGYGVSAYQHRFSVDADLVIREHDVNEFLDVLEDQGFEEAVDRDLVYGGRFIAYEKPGELPVTIDLLVESLVCRQTDASWRYDYFRINSEPREITGSQRKIRVPVPEPELLVAVKLHSGRKTDARDAVAIADTLDTEKLERHLDRGDTKKLADTLETVLEILENPGFEDSFKGVFQQTTLPEQNIQKIRGIIKQLVTH